MKTRLNYCMICLLFAGISLFSGSAVYPDDSHNTYMNDFSGEKQEEKAFFKKLKQDDHKIDLAIKNTKTLIEKSKNKPYLPELYLRLADLYVEKSRVTFFIRKAEKQQPLTALEALPANALKNQAIEVYQRILDHFPNFDQTDKVHFYMAHEFRELGKVNDMIVHYRNIIQSYPNSQYVSESYLLLGDHYFKSQNLDMAEKHYSAIINYPGCPAYPIAQYKLGWCHINRAEFKKAIHRFGMALASAENQQTTDIDTYRHVDIRLESLIDMAYCYVDCYKDHLPETAIAYFQSYAWSLPSYTSCLEKLAGRYFIKKKWHHSAVIYRKLSELQEDTERKLSYSRKIFECVRESKSYDQTALDIHIIVNTLKRQRYSTYIPAKEKKAKEKEYEVFAREMITRLHDIARKQKNVSAFQQAADAYMIYLDFFQNSPVYWEMTMNCAESLFASDNFYKAGQYYERIYHEVADNDTIDKKNTLFSALTAYYHALKGKDQLNAYEKNYCRQGLLSTGKIYVNQYPNAPEIPDVFFNMAWIAYDEGRYDDAINEFKSFIDAYPNGRPARAAVHLVLDAYYMKEDFKNLIQFGNNIIKNKNITDQNLKKEVSTIVASAEQKIVYSLSLTAIDDWEKGRSQMLSMAQDHSDSTLGEKALIALLGPSLEKQDIQTFFQVGNNLIQKFPDSKDHEKTLILLIQTSMSMGQYKMLAHYLTTFCNDFPDHEKTPIFMEQASQIYQQLGNVQTANALLEKVFQYYSHHPKESQDKIDMIVFQWIENLIQKGLLSKTITVLKNALPYLSTNGQIIAHLKMASIYYQLNQIDMAKKVHKQIFPKLKSTKDPMLLDTLLEMIYYSVSKPFETYMKCKMTATLDEKLLKQKQTLFSNLQKEYTQMLSYPSPRWMLSACAHLYCLYKEFARFLRNAPTPELSETEKKQYRVLIEKKATSYDQNAERFQKTFIDRYQTWASCSKDLLPYVQMVQSSIKAVNQPFSQDLPITNKTLAVMPDKELIPYYQQRLNMPKALTPVFELAKSYIAHKDFGQAVLLIETALELKDISLNNRATLLTIQGLCCLYQQKDYQAQTLFEKALTMNPDNPDANINLGGLLWHYAHELKATKILENKPNEFYLTAQWVHPKAYRLRQAIIK